MLLHDILYVLALSSLLTLLYMSHCSEMTPIIAYISYCLIIGSFYYLASYIGNPYIITPLLYTILILVVNCIY